MIPVILGLLTLGSPAQGPETSSAWGRGIESPAQLAAKMDDTIHGLKSTKHTGYLSFENKVGKGAMECYVNIVNAKRFRITGARFGKAEQNGLERAVRIADGKNFRSLDIGVWSKIVPVANRPIVNGPMVAEWPIHNTLWMFDSVGTTARPFSKLVAEAAKAGSKVTVRSEYRNFKRAGIRYENSRIVIEDRATKGKKRFYEIVFDPKKKLPVYMDSQINDGSVWSGRYTWKVKWEVGALKKPVSSDYEFPKK